MFTIGSHYPDRAHRERIKRYRENKKLFLGQHYEIFQRVQHRLSSRQSEVLYISTNLPGVICKKSADFLFGERPTFTAGKSDNSNEQKAIERFIDNNDLHITNYESALSNAYRGDSFYKIRYGQEYEGAVDKTLDPFRVIIESQNPEYVFPETALGDTNKTVAYHIAYPVLVKHSDNEEWILNVESHYPGRIQYRKYRMNPIVVTVDNEINEWQIYAEILAERKEVATSVPFPLIVHVPNYATDDSWEGIDDVSEHKPLFDEINHRLSQIASILDKHADPAMAVPAGTLGEDERGNPIFRVGIDKVFEVMGKDEVIPQYITWDGQLQAAFTELEHLIKMLLINAEIPEIALGVGDAGTSGASGLAIKWRLNSILAKINRKRQYYDKALKRVLLLAQLLEKARQGKVDYEVTVPKVKFKDGLPDDELELANIMSIRTSGKPTISQKAAMMWLDDLTEEQAEAELARMKTEEESADPSIFQEAEEGEE
ncbi:phage portal protein [Heliorestis convoluta]|uniref:Phage portal, SPP1 Gp6-like family protein n=1 Tax=Heliorestis convoluta TaxID=356322 RepID=A0A5Q2N4Y8_9FIRM|nr:phage portal protein [Heliorestis convoluta]QGG47645.1 phage portal, SPP1 Gp6-like family protein [Heliorestis convoluta]